jgi:general secretion pathway protein A
VLVIDEAHKLSLEVLEEIRLLGNFEGAAEKYLQVLLLGQSELDDILDRHDVRQLKQRIALRLYIDPLSGAEIQQYIHFRWAKAGARESAPFTSDALAGIAHWSHGIPRLVNSICDSALMMAFGDESPLVGLNYVRAAAVNLALSDAPPRAALASVPLRNAVAAGEDSFARAPLENAAPEPGGDRKPNSSVWKRLGESLLPH